MNLFKIPLAAMDTRTGEIVVVWEHLPRFAIRQI